jgi:hypothetical protein
VSTRRPFLTATSSLLPSRKPGLHPNHLIGRLNFRSRPFAGDVFARAFIGHRLFPMAAPTGGAILIAAWLALAIAALAGAFQRG